MDSDIATSLSNMKKGEAKLGTWTVDLKKDKKSLAQLPKIP